MGGACTGCRRGGGGASSGGPSDRKGAEQEQGGAASAASGAEQGQGTGESAGKGAGRAVHFVSVEASPTSPPEQAEAGAVGWAEPQGRRSASATRRKIVKWAKPGYKAGIKCLESFIQNRIKLYETDRNDPNQNALSNMSPWTHFGQVSSQRCAVEVKKYSSKFSKAVAGYLEGKIALSLKEIQS